MKIEPINAYEFTCTPMNREDCAIRSVLVTIYAKDRAEADQIFQTQAHSFFDRDLNLMVTQFGGGGFRQVKDDEGNKSST